MTFFFDLAKIEKYSDNRADKFLEILEQAYYKKLPRNGQATRRFAENFTGSSFLFNPEPLFKLKNRVDIYHIVQYIKLAARRNYSLYKYHKIKTLPLSYFPDLNLKAVSKNPLLKIHNNELIFIYE